jgi:hypothetical protein
MRKLFIPVKLLVGSSGWIIALLVALIFAVAVWISVTIVNWIYNKQDHE